MVYDPVTDRYQPIEWDAAFALIARHLNNLASPDQAEFYTSGRASNEAAFLYQLFVRAYGTNNFPDCSNMCHEASGVALARALASARARSPSTTSSTPTRFSSGARTPAPTTRACSNRCATR
jgi:anaerobic selenocysteine-containing dehydrogenase